MNQAGEYRFRVELYSMNFRGLELEQEIRFKVLPTSEKRQEFMKKLEKQEPKKLENSFFQEMIQQMANPDDDEEDEEEEVEESENDEVEAKNKSANSAKNRRGKNRRNETNNLDREY